MPSIWPEDTACIAHGPPAARFRPGHSKWDYNYSILTLRPDVSADEWDGARGFLAAHADAYERLSNGIYVRRDTQLADRDGLAAGL